HWQTQKTDFIFDLRSQLIFGIIMTACSFTVYCSDAVLLESSNLPIFILDTHGKSIKDSPRIEATMSVIWDRNGKRNHISDTGYHYNGRITIEIRGSYSQTFPKKQYAITTISDSGTENKVSLLGLPVDEDWILAAPFSDKTLLRNALIYRLGQEFGRYTTKTRFCELILNNEYQGVYVLTERIKRGKDRVNIAKLKQTDNSGDDLTGGYIIKVDKITGESSTNGWDLPDPGSKRVYMHYPKPDNITTEQFEYIKTYINEIHTAINNTTAPLSDSLLRQRLDISSFVDYYIISEFTKNVDGYAWSVFMHKDKDSNGGKLTMGPIWDFNIAFGNVNYGNAEKIAGFLDEDTKYDINWWGQLICASLLTSKLKCRWLSLRQNTLSLQHIETLIDSLVTVINEAQERNFKRWNVLDSLVWPNNYVGGSYENELSYLKSWILDRITWLDKNMPGECQESHIDMYKNESGDAQLFPYAQSSCDLRSKNIVIIDIILKNRDTEMVLHDVSNNGSYAIYATTW
ncbi:MAG TPA: CotH kinase family protein, partial [Chitinispirillaceae bacterium]|nr:CotH kinase family protein [Chitinispirillaceae bacterium]